MAKVRSGSKGKTNGRKKGRSRRQMKRSVMGTLSVLFMITAVIVALIPVPKAAALSSDAYDDYKASGKFNSNASANVVAYLPTSYSTEAFPVYASGDGMLRVAYGKNGGISTGIVVGYNKDSSASSPSIDIPNEMPAFRFNESLGTYVAVDQSNYFLYYRSQAYQNDLVPEIYSPCTYSSYSEWEAYGTELFRTDKNKMADVLSQITNSVSGNTPAELTASSQLMIPINYIADNNLTYKIDTGKTVENMAWPDGEYTTDNDDNEGVFENVTNVSSVIIPDSVYAIGDRAFKGCNAIGSISLGNGVRSIGNEAFAQCRSMSSVSFATPANLREIGDEAFSECANLESVVIPKSVQKLGNFCFYNCEKMTAVSLTGEGQEDGSDANLTTIGHGLFYNCYNLSQVKFPPTVMIADANLTCYGCRQLTSLELPSHAVGTWNHDNVTGCYSLNYVVCESNGFGFECPDAGTNKICTKSDDPSETFGRTNLGQGSPDGDNFKISDDFVIMAYYDSKAEQYTRYHNELAFGYLDSENRGKYRKYVDGYFYTVNESGNLVGFSLADNTNNGYNVLIPDKIGPYSVKQIDAGTFAGNTDIRYLKVPASIEGIAGGAFTGCENLRNVYFENSDGVSVGEGAFATNANAGVIDEGGLKFFGDIGGSNPSNPYYYAMNTGAYNNTKVAPADNINFCTSFPSNMEVENDGGKATLVDIPVYDRLKNTYEKFNKYFAAATPPSESELESLLSDSKNLYSLSCYVSSEDHMNEEYEHSFYRENMVAARAFAKKEGYLTGEMTGEEQAIIDAIYNVNVPSGVDYLKGGATPLFYGNEYVQSVTLGSVHEIPDNEFAGCTAMTTFTMNHDNSLGEYAETLGVNAFGGNTSLTSVTLPSTLSYIKREPNAANGAEDGAALPFAGCTSLKDVDFGSSPYYDCQDAIIYKLDNGSPTSIVEVLETRGKSGAGRSNVILPETVSEIYPKAFSNCKEISSVDLTDTSISNIPALCFNNAENLSTCKLPETVQFITKDAFDNTNVGELYVYGDDTSLYWIDNLHDKNVVIYGHLNSSAHKFVQNEEARDPETKYEFAELPTITYTIYYHDCDPAKDYTDQSNWIPLPEEQVAKNGVSTRYDAYTSYLNKWPGYKFSRWDQQDALVNGVTHDIYTVAVYEKSNIYTQEGQWTVTLRDVDYDEATNTGYEYHVVVNDGDEFSESDVPDLVPRTGYKAYYDPDITKAPLKINSDTLILIKYYPDPNYVPPKDPDPEKDPIVHTVTFMADGLMFGKQNVVDGNYITPLKSDPVKKGYKFVYWTPINYTEIAVTEDMIIEATFEKDTETSDVSGSDDVSGTSSDNGSSSGKSGKSNKKNNGNSGNSNNGGSSSSSSNGKTYTVSFVDYDGKLLSTQIVEDGQKPGKFPYEPVRKGYKFVSWSPANYASVTIHGDLVVQATYQKDPNYVPPKSASVSGNGSVTGKVVPKSNTRIDVAKSGISNRNLASASVDGSNDNFIVKVTDSDEARSAIEAALLKQYGSLDNLKYFAMDISLYDSTGTTKILNTNGLKVDVTIPIPDAMAGYAGNNKVCTVDSAGNMEKVYARLITIDNVPCVSFTAPHFSPYALYVETNNLMATNGVSDASPKTGDPIHPKWFLAIGLAIASILMFALRPSKKIVKVIA
ncbi:MAG: leucine-rich repeat domain-containing protein [Lachnospiraceae bacterium]|nr:leucine-rich repeat domain-containing protein [Lachnospiraceae bacterium]